MGRHVSPPHIKIQVVLANHPAHTSKETGAYLATVLNRFDFVVRPTHTHAPWFNYFIERFFANVST